MAISAVRLEVIKLLSCLPGGIFFPRPLGPYGWRDREGGHEFVTDSVRIKLWEGMISGPWAAGIDLLPGPISALDVQTGGAGEAKEKAIEFAKVLLERALGSLVAVTEKKKLTYE